MDETEPYTGYDDYDPGMASSPMAYDSYGDGETSSAMPSVDKSDTPPALTASYNDSGRLDELNLVGDGFVLSQKYANPNRGYGEVPLVALSPDDGRVAIHPLVIVDTPTGMDESRWKQLDIDGIFTSSYDSRAIVEEEDGIDETETQSLVPVNAATETGDSGSDSDGEDDENVEHDSSEMPFLDHLEEFRWALLKSITTVFIGLIASWFLAEEFISTITRLADDAELNLMYMKILGPIMLKLQTALFMGIAISAPFIFYFLWSFIAPGLYKREKKWILPAVLAGSVCFLIGASIAYFVIIPFILKFIKVLMVKGVVGMFEINDFILWMLKFTVLFGILFEMPVVSYFLAKIGILKYQWMTQYRKYAIVCIFVIGAILTPPDPISQVMMAIPLLLLYEISIIVARIAGRNTLI